MLDFLRKGLGKVIAVLFVLSMIGTGITGGIILYLTFDNFFYNDFVNLLGFILGAGIGVLISALIGILTYGLVATIINIADITEKINYQLSKISNKLDNLSAISTNNSTTISTNNSTTDSTNNSTTDSTNDSWVCKKCGETNYGNIICSKCGR